MSRDGLPTAMATVEKSYGPPTKRCDVCRGGEWAEDGVTAIALHHIDCPRGKEDEARDA